MTEAMEFDPPYAYHLRSLGHHELASLIEKLQAKNERLEVRIRQVAEEHSLVFSRCEKLQDEIEGWAGVIESCLPTDEGYEDDTEQVLKNVIKSMRRSA